MAASKGSQIPHEYLLPAAVGLAVVFITAAVLYYLNSRKSLKGSGKRGTRMVYNETGTDIVRRSTRSSKKPNRFEPIVHGPGGTPARETTAPEKSTPKSGRTPKVEVKSEETPLLKKVATRPRKTPAAKDAASPPTSPMRTRRALRSPK